MIQEKVPWKSKNSLYLYCHCSHCNACNKEKKEKESNDKEMKEENDVVGLEKGKKDESGDKNQEVEAVRNDTNQLTKNVCFLCYNILQLTACLVIMIFLCPQCPPHP